MSRTDCNNYSNRELKTQYEWSIRSWETLLADGVTVSILEHVLTGSKENIILIGTCGCLFPVL